MPQLRALLDGLSHRAYYLQCQADPWMAEEDYVEVAYPHPYLSMWLECKRYPLPNGAPALPEPEKGPLDQDADLMLAFEVLEEAQATINQEEELRARNREAAQHMDFPLEH